MEIRKPISFIVSAMNDPGITAAPVGRPARERILSAARTLFHREGIRATGVERVAELAQVSKRTLYQHVSSKEELVEAYLRRIHDTGGPPNEQALDTPGASPRNQTPMPFHRRRKSRAICRPPRKSQPRLKGESQAQ